jgi:hypothetical protein
MPIGPEKAKLKCRRGPEPFPLKASCVIILAMTTTTTHALPSPLPPTEAEVAAWNALTRDEQLARYREYLSHPDCDRVSSASMADILTQARAHVAGRRRA